MVVAFHHRTGLQVFALVLATGSFLIRVPPLLTSLRPELVPVTNAAPDGSYSTAPSAEGPSERISRPDRLYRPRMVCEPESRPATMFRPLGVVYPIGFASPGSANVVTWPVARVSCSRPPLPEK